MKFCGNCGNKVEDNVRFCPSCGEAMGSDSVGGGTATQSKSVNFQNRASSNSESINDQKDAEDNKLMGILAYILFFIPLLAGPKDSKFVKYHTNQGLVLFIATIAWVIIERILSSILVTLFLRVYLIWGLISAILWILSLLTYIFVVLAIIGIINAANGVKKPLPVIGNIQILK